MASRTDQQTFEFPDGSEIEWTVQTNDAAVFRIFDSELSRRVRTAERALGRNLSLLSPSGLSPARRRNTDQSTTTLSLPDGEVTVSIDATGTTTHEYLRSLVRAAVAYTHACHVDVPKAVPLAVLCFLVGAVPLALGAGFLALPAFAAGAVVGLHLLVYLLSARGVPLGLSRIPDPFDTTY